MDPDLLFAKMDPANDVARERLQTAAAAYADVLSQRPPDMVAERATMGLAKARESLGELLHSFLVPDADQRSGLCHEEACGHAT